jgi:S-DNA-T family DNA segregation ATPase FtsK/SpoIIIE
VQPAAAAVQQPQAGQDTPLPVRRIHQQQGTDALPSFDLLDVPVISQRGHSPEELATQARFLEQKLREFGVEGEVVQVLPGPVITMYEFAPAAGVKVNKIVSLQDDLALVMEAVSVRVVAPIPGKAVVGIEIPHKRRETVRLRDLLVSEEWHTSTSQLSLALGKDILGRPVITDLALIPHLLIAGATGSGKSVGLNSLICSLLFRATPTDVRLIMIDPKMLEFSVYDGIPHLLVPVVTEPKKAAIVLRRVVEEMGRRYQILAAQGVRSIAQYNQMLEEELAGRSPGRARVQDGQEAALTPAEKLPYLVVVIDELSDLMMISAREVEDSLMRLAQMARAAGIHLIVATQRPSVDVLTGVIKANFPARLSFQVTSKVDSRTILDTNGAETLLGRGDMLFLAPGTSKPQRVHGAYVSEAEIGRLVEAWKAAEQPRYDDGFLAPGGDHVSVEEDEYDEKYDEAIALVTKMGQASISMLQRRLRVGYNRAARMIEMMEKDGIVGPADGIKPREVLVRNTFDDV